MNYYDSIAKGYDRLHKEEQLHKLRIMITELQRSNLARGSILDVGCVTGFSLDIIAHELGRKVIGIEPSKGMIDRYSGEQKIMQGCAEQLPFPDQHFAGVVSVTAIQNFEDIPLAVREMRRVALKNAPVLVSCLKRSEKVEAVSSTLAELLVVEEVLEEAKDIIFLCRRI